MDDPRWMGPATGRVSVTPHVRFVETEFPGVGPLRNEPAQAGPDEIFVPSATPVQGGPGMQGGHRDPMPTFPPAEYASAPDTVRWLMYAHSQISSVLSTRTRLAPLSAAISTSMGSSRSWRGAIVTLHAPAEFCFILRRYLRIIQAHDRRVGLKPPPAVEHAGCIG
eukprot:scaffold11423_cov123-Isochrysis_galbana.AAC.13